MPGGRSPRLFKSVRPTPSSGLRFRENYHELLDESAGSQHHPARCRCRYEMISLAVVAERNCCYEYQILS